jgi:hypothetical protein
MHFRSFVETCMAKDLDLEMRSSWVNPRSRLRSRSYTNKYKEKHNAHKDPFKKPFDVEVSMLVGQGTRNDHLYVGDSSIDTTSLPSLSKIRASIEISPHTSLRAICKIRVCPSLIIHLVTCLDCNTDDIVMT